MKKSERGITLIALVITIIILLILAGVSISMLVGDNGVLNKAKNAKQNTQRAEVIEQARLDVSDKQVNNLDSKLKKSELIEVLNEYFENVPENSDDILSETVIAKQEYGGYSIKVSEIYNNGFLDEVAVIPPELNPPESTQIYEVVYTDGVRGVTVFPDEGYDQKHGEPTHEFTNLGKGGNPTREGYVFVKWQPEVKLIVNANDADDDGRIVYEAVWEKISEENVTPNPPDSVSISDLKFTITPTVRYPSIGEEFGYHIKISNDGRAYAKVLVSDELPSGLEFVGASDGGTFNPETRVVTWDEVTVPVGSKEVSVWVKATNSGDIRNEAVMSFNGESSGANTNVTVQ